MKKVLVLVILVILMMFLVGCDTSKSVNVEITTDGGRYINTSESISVDSYNKYRLIKSSIEDEDGVITVILKFDKPIQ